MTAIVRNSAGLSRLAWTAGLIVGASLPHWASLPVWMPALLCATVLWRFGARLLGWPLPGPWLQRLLAILALAAVLLQFQTINGLAAGTALLVVMVALKFLEARGQRDHMVLTVIAYFLVFASVLGSEGLLKGIYLFLFVWLTTFGLIQVGRRGPLIASPQTAKLAARLVLQAVPIMVLLFLLFPRLPGPLWGMPRDASATSGLSDTMSPGDITSLGLSSEVAFRVEFFGDRPPQSELYWRGPVLADFDGRAWSQQRGSRGDASKTIEYIGLKSEYEVSFESDTNGWILAIDMPERWAGNNRWRSINMTSDYQLSTSTTTGGSYTITSYSHYRALEPLSDAQIASFKRLPPDLNPRTRELVASLTADSPDVPVLVERALGVFRAEDFYYTLTPPPLGRHTADEFLFDTREGFCEHYASAFAIMMRMAGIPARVVTGYQGGELNNFGAYYIVRQSDAHAWTEIWTPEDGWTRVDPTAAIAPERISLGSTRARASTVAAGTGPRRWTIVRQTLLAWDAVNTYWNDWVVGYGPRLQRALVGWLGFERPRWRLLLTMTVIGVAVVLGVMSLLSIRHLPFRLRHRGSLDAAALDFARFGRRLARLGVEPIQPGETPTRYAERARARLPDLASPITEITGAYLKARYELDEDGAARHRLRELVREFRPRYALASR